jgi:spore coat polysaccharide biosynthesis predicted glycosyltransferase SpsG
MRYVFRTDASLAIGAGHVMRTSAIAEEMILRGSSTVFIGEILGMPWLSKRISNLGFEEVYENPRDFSPNVKSDVLVIDSYNIPINNHFIQPKNWLAIVNIFDDFTPNYDCNLRIHPGLVDSWPNLSNIQTLGGPKFFPIRKSLSRNVQRVANNHLEIIVTAGGSDAQGFVGAVATELFKSKEDFKVALVTNQEIESGLDDRFTKVLIGSNFDNISKKADLVFSTASTTSLEFIAHGCVVGVGCAVPNQRAIYKKLGDLGVAMPIGVLHDDKWQLDSEIILDLTVSRSLQMSLKKNAANLIDFLGAYRIGNAIHNLAVSKSDEN